MPGLRTAMHAQKRTKNTQVPDVAQVLMQPRKAAQQNGLSKSLHVQSRRNGVLSGGARRRPPSVSQVPPAFPRRFPSFDQAHMLQPSLYPSDRVRISLVWAFVEATPQERQA